MLVFDRAGHAGNGPANPVTEDELRDVVSQVLDDRRDPAGPHPRQRAGGHASSRGSMPVSDVRDERNGRKSVAALLLTAHLPRANSPRPTP